MMVKPSLPYPSLKPWNQTPAEWNCPTALDVFLSLKSWYFCGQWSLAWHSSWIPPENCSFVTSVYLSMMIQRSVFLNYVWLVNTAGLNHSSIYIGECVWYIVFHQFHPMFQSPSFIIISWFISCCLFLNYSSVPIYSSVDLFIQPKKS